MQQCFTDRERQFLSHLAGLTMKLGFSDELNTGLKNVTESFLFTAIGIIQFFPLLPSW